MDISVGFESGGAQNRISLSLGRGGFRIYVLEFSPRIAVHPLVVEFHGTGKRRAQNCDERKYI